MRRTTWIGRKKLRVLVADEQTDRRRRICETLRTLGALVHATTSGRAVLRLLVEEPFDLALVALSLPNCGGANLAATARSRGVLTPLALLAPLADDAVRTTIEEAGDAVLIDEPFDDGRLLALVDDVIAHGALEALRGERDGRA